MALNELCLEGRIHSKPQETDQRTKVEFILRHESPEGNAVRFFPVEMYEYLARRFGAKEGAKVLILGELDQRQSVDPRTGEVRLWVMIRALELRELKEPPPRGLDSDEIPF